MNRALIFGATISAVFLYAAGTTAALHIPDKPDEADTEVREYDELVLKDNTAKVWKGEFRRDDQGKPEVLPNGKYIFDVKEGDARISLKVDPRQIDSVRVKQTEEQVWWKRARKLPAGRLDVPKYVKFAQDALGKEFLDLAEDVLRRALKIDDKNLDLYIELGRLLRRRFKFNDELILYEAGLEAKLPRPEGIIARLGDLLHALGLHAEAEIRFKEALDLEPRHGESLLGLGKLYLDLRRYAEAADRLGLASKNTFEKERKGEVLKWLGRAHLKLGDLDKARQSFEDAAMNLPEDPEVKACLGSVFYFQGNLPFAKQKYMEILDISETDLASRVPGEEEESEEEEDGEEKDEDESGTGKEEERDEWGPGTEFDPFRSNAMGNLALCLLKEGVLSKAEHYLKLSVGLDPTSSFPWVALGYLREKQERWGEAKDAYDKALTIDPGDPAAHYSVGVLYLRSGETGSALSAFLAAAEYDPDFTDALLKLGRLAVQEGRGKEGVLYFKRALALCPAVADWHVGLGLAHALSGDPAKAGGEFRKALDIDPTHPIAKAGVLYALYYAPNGDEEAYNRIKRILEEPEGYPESIVTYFKRIKGMIEANRGKVQWLDDFERADSTQVARKWDQREGLGPVMRIHKGRVAIEGNLIRAGETVLERKVEAGKFVRFEADLFARDISNFKAGIAVTHCMAVGNRRDIRGGVRIGKNAKGKIVVWEWDLSVSRWREKAEYGPWPVTQDGSNRLVVELYKDPADPREDFKLLFFMNGSPLGEPYMSERFKRGFKSGEIWCGVFASADEKGINVQLEADNVRLVTFK